MAIHTVSLYSLLISPCLDRTNVGKKHIFDVKTLTQQDVDRIINNNNRITNGKRKADAPTFEERASKRSTKDRTDAEDTSEGVLTPTIDGNTQTPHQSPEESQPRGEKGKQFTNFSFFVVIFLIFLQVFAFFLHLFVNLRIICALLRGRLV